MSALNHPKVNSDLILSCARLRVRGLFFMLNLWVCLSVQIPLEAQDPIFSQFYLAPLQLNPGLAGLTDGARFSANYRNQFPGFNQAYRTYALSYDQYFKDISSGAGLWMLSDDAGDGILKTVKIAGIYAYRLKLDSDLYLRMGTEIGFVQTTLNWSLLTFGDQIDDYYGKISPGGTPYPTDENAPEKNSTIYPDIGLGMVLYGKHLYGGIALRHLNQPRTDFLETNPNLTPGIPMRWTFHAGGTWPVFSGGFGRKTDALIAPAIMYVYQGPFRQFMGGLSFEAGPLTIGGFYRNTSGQSESIIGSIGLRSKQLKIGYSYDATISGFQESGGSHEIGLIFVLPYSQKESRYNDCLQLFR